MEKPLMENPDSARQRPDKNLSPVVDGQEYCPQCGRALQPRECKLICECGYFMSCSDF